MDKEIEDKILWRLQNVYRTTDRIRASLIPPDVKSTEAEKPEPDSAISYINEEINKINCALQVIERETKRIGTTWETCKEPK